MTAPNQTIELPLYQSVDVDIDWDDSSFDSYYDTGLKTHTYSTPGTYQVKIYNYLEKFGQDTQTSTTPLNNIDKLTAVLDFGNIGLKSLSGAFLGAIALTQVPATLPTSVLDVSYLFFRASQINDVNISGWDVSNITNFSYIFFEATSFNQSIDGWITTETDLSYLLYGSGVELPGWLLTRLTTL
jgi:surface protein